MRQACAMVSMAVLLSAAASKAEISPDLACALERAATTGERLSVVLTLKSPPEIVLLQQGFGLQSLPPEERASALIKALQGRFHTSLSDVMYQLHSLPEINNLHGYWAGMMIAFEGPAEIIRKLGADPAFELELDLTMELPRTRPCHAPASMPGHAEPGLQVINAAKLWEVGYTGEGVTIMSLDTGVDLDHPALSRSWLGNHVPPAEAWFDPVYGTDSPRDYGIDPPGHGTMTMGVMVGMDPATSDTVGVAFGADWIAAGDSINSISKQVACLQWALDPDGNPMTVDDMPDVVNCSWTRGVPGCKETGLTMAISALEAAGVAVVFAAGNYGPAPGSVRWPARMNGTDTDVFAVGFVNGHDPALPVCLASGRGPTICCGLGNVFKPEVVAPGESVRTTYLQGQYATASGTSLSAPHVSGAIALLKQAFPEKTGTELKLLLMEGARDLGEEGEDNDYGRGCIDVYAAYLRGLATAVAEDPGLDWSLRQNYPNPFNASTTIKYELPKASTVRLSVYDILGREVSVLLNERKNSGSYELKCDAAGLSSGVYVYRIQAGDFVQAKKFVVLK